MEFTLSITGSNATDLQAVLAAFSNSGLQVNGTLPAAPKKSKQPTITDDASGPAMPVVTGENADTSGSTSTANGTYAIEQVRAAVQAKANGGKKAEVKALLTEFGTDSVSKMEVGKYAAFMEKLNAL